MILRMLCKIDQGGPISLYPPFFSYSPKIGGICVEKDDKF